MKRIDRRGFLKTGLTGAAGLAISPAVFDSKFTNQNNIITRTLGKTGMKVPVISFGVMRADNASLCKAAYENGIKLFDTANGYQNGNNETMLGNLFKDVPRDTFYLATKVKPAGVDREGKPGPQTTAEDFLARFETSLGRLQMKYVDILYVHDISNVELLNYKPIINALAQLKKEGKIKFAGFSTHRNEHIVIDAASSMNVYDVILTSYNFRHDNLDELNKAIRKAAAAGIGIVAMKTMAGGKLVNASAALKWALSNPDIHTTIPGMTAFDHLEVNLKVLSDINLTDQEKNDLVAHSANPGLYCGGCSKCVPTCPKNLPIPDLMRAYMYAYGYSNPLMAHSLLHELEVVGNPCKDCNECSVTCSRNFNVRNKIADISRLGSVPAEFLT
ncbi:MAG: aldo/keto reductase [Bacteroidales bacterium]|nr:aldo/keto reductase [Bacteroidales bacterium]